MLKGKMYSYLVSFVVSVEGYCTQSFGDIIIQRDTKLNTIATIEELRKFLLSKINGAKSVCFTNIILLDGEK